MIQPFQLSGPVCLEEFRRSFPFSTIGSNGCSQGLRYNYRQTGRRRFSYSKVKNRTGILPYYYKGIACSRWVQSVRDECVEPEESASTDPLKKGVESLSNEVLRQIVGEKRSVDAKNVILDRVPTVGTLNSEQCLDIIISCISAGNYELLVSIFRSMLARKDTSVWQSSEIDSLGSSQFEWPKATAQMSTEIIKALCRNLDTKNALEILNILRFRGVQPSEEIHFGYVVYCADGSGRPLALMQPHEGSKIASDSFSKYEYEIFSGIVVKSDSESLVASLSWLKQLGSKLGQVSSAAMHTVTVESPTGQQRTFKFGTYLANAPAKVNDRISIVCAPEQGKSSRRELRYRGLLSPSPPGKRPGEALSITNHTIGDSILLNRPSETLNSPINRWLLSSIVVLASVDAASSLLDPMFPVLIAATVGSSTLIGSVGTKVVLPNLKKLPESSLGIQETRQRLLQEHVRLMRNISQLIDETSSDIRTLARLWQLLNKMNSLDDISLYVSRIERVVEAKNATEERLEARISMLNEYTKVLSMIEIEVEMETEIPVAEYEGKCKEYKVLIARNLRFTSLSHLTNADIQKELCRLSEIEELQAEWTAKVEAQDEVEKLLRSYPSINEL